jgi:S-adenosylmethionine synthetase
VSLFPSRLGTDPILANDTSCGVGFAPLTPLERAVYAVERGLNDQQTMAQRLLANVSVA